MLRKGHMWDWGSEQQVTLEKTKILVKQIKAPGISPAGLPFRLNAYVTPAVIIGHWCKDNRREYSQDFGPSFGKE